MNLLKRIVSALRFRTQAEMMFRIQGVEPCSYCGADEPAAWFDLRGSAKRINAQIFCPCCAQHGPKARTLDEAKAYWDAAQYAEIARLRKLAPACFSVEVSA